MSEDANISCVYPSDLMILMESVKSRPIDLIDSWTVTHPTAGYVIGEVWLDPAGEIYRFDLSNYGTRP